VLGRKKSLNILGDIWLEALYTAIYPHISSN
jgi:hypothetical protein